MDIQTRSVPPKRYITFSKPIHKRYYAINFVTISNDDYKEPGKVFFSENK